MRKKCIDIRGNRVSITINVNSLELTAILIAVCAAIKAV